MKNFNLFPKLYTYANANAYVYAYLYAYANAYPNAYTYAYAYTIFREAYLNHNLEGHRFIRMMKEE